MSMTSIEVVERPSLNLNLMYSGYSIDGFGTRWEFYLVGNCLEIQSKFPINVEGSEVYFEMSEKGVLKIRNIGSDQTFKLETYSIVNGLPASLIDQTEIPFGENEYKLKKGFYAIAEDQQA